MAQRSLVHLDHEDCLALLRTERVGRLAYCDGDGPVAVPVNFALAGEDIVIRVEPGNEALAAEPGLVAFEVDHITDEQRSGWSVVVRGRLSAVALDDVPALLREMPAGPPLPWAEGVHSVWLRIHPETVTGRRLDSYAVPLVI